MKGEFFEPYKQHFFVFEKALTLRYLRHDGNAPMTFKTFTATCAVSGIANQKTGYYYLWTLTRLLRRESETREPEASYGLQTGRTSSGFAWTLYLRSLEGLGTPQQHGHQFFFSINRLES